LSTTSAHFEAALLVEARPVLLAIDMKGSYTLRSHLLDGPEHDLPTEPTPLELWMDITSSRNA
jgi:hypothetical protein